MEGNEAGVVWTIWSGLRGVLMLRTAGGVWGGRAVTASV